MIASEPLIITVSKIVSGATLRRLDVQYRASLEHRIPASREIPAVDRSIEPASAFLETTIRMFESQKSRITHERYCDSRYNRPYLFDRVDAANAATRVKVARFHQHRALFRCQCA